MLRNYLTFRRSTNISHKPFENYLNRIQEFVSYNIKFGSKYDFELNAIANINKTPLYLNMPLCTTVHNIGSKKVNIRTQGQEN